MLNVPKINPDLMAVRGRGRIIIVLFMLNGMKVILLYMLIQIMINMLGV